MGKNLPVFTCMENPYDVSTSKVYCFSINFQVNVMSLSRKFCVYLHFTPVFTSCRKHELRKRQSKFYINMLQVKNFTLKFLSEVLFFFLVACYLTLSLIVVHDSYTVSRHFEKML